MPLSRVPVGETGVSLSYVNTRSSDLALAKSPGVCKRTLDDCEASGSCARGGYGGRCERTTPLTQKKGRDIMG